MFLFVIGCILLVAVIPVLLTLRAQQIPRAIPIAAASLLAVLGIVATVWSTAIYIEDTEGGIIIRKFGAPLNPDQIIATDGQSGPQADVLSPGWKFGYWPWLFDLEIGRAHV